MQGVSSLKTNANGGLDVKLVKIKSKSGKGTFVDERYAPNFQGFINELEGTGYKIDQLGGYVDRNMRGGTKKSMHAFGAAIDINWDKNPMGPKFITDMQPDVVGPMAAKYGLGWGGNWKSVKDAMHFSMGSMEGGSVKINRETPVKVTGWDSNYKYEAPSKEDNVASGGVEFNQTVDKSTDTTKSSSATLTSSFSSTPSTQSTSSNVASVGGTSNTTAVTDNKEVTLTNNSVTPKVSMTEDAMINKTGTKNSNITVDQDTKTMVDQVKTKPVEQSGGNNIAMINGGGGSSGGNTVSNSSFSQKTPDPTLLYAALNR